MSRLPFAVLAITTAWAVIGAASVAQTPPRDAPGAPMTTTGTSSISGVVVAEGSSPAPVRRAEVTITPVGGAPIQPSALTDDQGRFSVDGLTAGRYVVTVSKGGYVRRAYGATRPYRPGTPVNVAENQRVTGLTIPLARGGVIEGRLVDETGMPAVGVMVRAAEFRTQTTGELTLRISPEYPAAFDETDDRGMYRIFGLPPGEYAVMASPRLAPNVRGLAETDFRRAQQGRASAGTSAAPNAQPAAAGAASDVVTVGYAPVYFPGTTEAASASAVRLGTGEERTDIDFRLQLIRMARVEGVLTTPAGLTSDAVQLLLLPQNLIGDGVTPMRGSVSSDGRFSFSSVAPGRYTLTARAGGTGMTLFRSGGDTMGVANDVSTYSFGGAAFGAPGRGAGPGSDPLQVHWASADIIVEGHDVRDLAIALQPALTLSGRVTPATGATLPADLTTVRVSLNPMSTGGPVQALPDVNADASGVFRFAGVVPGRYRLNAAVPGRGARGPWTVSTATIGGRDALDIPVEISAADARADAVVTLTDLTQAVGGRLEDTTGRPAPEYTVLIFPDDAHLWAAGARRIRTTRPATDGSFQFADLPPGEYRVAALTDIEPSDLNDASFLQSIREAAVALSLAPGERKVQDFRIGL